MTASSFSACLPSFRSGESSPRQYLERCLDEIDRRDADVKAFAFLNVDAARAAADASTERYRAGQPLSPVDGMPIGIKDVFDTADMPTEFGSPIHQGRRPDHDAAHVYALRRGGAIILGKTVTSQFAIVGNGPTRNPHDLTRSPGATSAGSAAAVASGMLPVATGSQARGSIIRPASYCGVLGYKPTFGALNRAGCLTPAKSYDHLGALARSLDDLWRTVRHIAEVAGGDPGYPGLMGPVEAPAPRTAARIALLRSPGWSTADDAAKGAITTFAHRLSDHGVEILDGDSSREILTYERLASEVPAQWETLSGYENRWPLQSYRDRYAPQLHPGIVRGVEKSETISPDDYRAVLSYRRSLREAHAKLKPVADVLVTLAAPGSAPAYPDSGSSIFNELATFLGVPAVSVPVLTIDGLPLGIQIIGQMDDDYGALESAAFLLKSST